MTKGVLASVNCHCHVPKAYGTCLPEAVYPVRSSAYAVSVLCKTSGTAWGSRERAWLLSAVAAIVVIGSELGIRTGLWFHARFMVATFFFPFQTNWPRNAPGYILATVPAPDPTGVFAERRSICATCALSLRHAHAAVLELARVRALADPSVAQRCFLRHPSARRLKKLD